MEKLKKHHKVIIGVSSAILILALSSFTASYFTFLHHYEGNDLNNPWSASDRFDIRSIKTVEKEKGKDFIIMNLADIQVCDLEDLGHLNTIHKEITELVETYHPHLITLTGDQTWSNENLICLKSIISWLDGYQIPYCPIFGNHDHGNSFNSAVSGLKYCCELYEKGKYSLFQRGPNNLGNLGNYAINITEKGQIIETLYFMDLGYGDAITAQQEAWFKWNADGIKANTNGIYSRGMVFTHKDLPGHRKAYRHYAYGDASCAEGPVIYQGGFAAVKDTGFEQVAKEHGVHDFVSGHQHNNNFTINYEGARYTFATKTGECVFFYEDEDVYVNGATTIAFGEGLPKIEHHYVNRDSYRLK